MDVLTIALAVGAGLALSWTLLQVLKARRSWGLILLGCVIVGFTLAVLVAVA